MMRFLPYSSFSFLFYRVMSLEQALEVLEFKSLEDVDATTLKASFKRLALTEHPDRGGSQFDGVLSAYLFLSGVIRRHIGGRDKAGVLHPDDVQEAREDQYSSEMVLMVNEILDSIQRKEQNEFCRVFNEQYEDYKAKEDGKGFSSSESRGHSEWLSSDEKSTVSFESDGPYGPFTMSPPVIKEEDLHHLFEYTARCGKSPVTDLALLPEQMAIPSSSLGSMILPSSTEPFTSQLQEKPRYVDVQVAFTTNATVVDKLPVYQETTRTFEDLLKERDIVYQTEHDRDLQAIALYERVYQQQQTEHKKQIQEYFRSTGSSQWAICSAEPSDEKEESSFVINIGS